MDDKIGAFLHYGYLPQGGGTVSSFPFDIDLLTSSSSNPYKEYSESHLVEEGAKRLHDALTSAPKRSEKTHVIPLSGGLDSRAILGGLIDAGLTDNIVTVTFGTPGTFDYDIGNAVGQSVEVTHRKINLNDVEVTEELLLETLRNGPEWTFLFDAFYNRIVTREFGEESVYWSGFMGDPLAGSHLGTGPTTNFEEEQKVFSKKNKLPNVSVYKRSSFDPIRVLPDEPLVDANKLSYGEQLDFAIRQTQYIRPTVLVPEFEYRTPFLNEQWVKFIVNVPRRYRTGMYLYKKILIKLWPELFKLPTETYSGLPLTAGKHRVIFRQLVEASMSRMKQYIPWLPWPSDRGINYVDFASAIRTRSDFQSVVRSCITNLEQRGVVDWIDINSLWRTHQSGERDLAYPLLLLTALELNLIAGGEL
jgi:asparagine synthetase B (glutamine-hydrolysing)